MPAKANSLGLARLRLAAHSIRRKIDEVDSLTGKDHAYLMKDVKNLDEAVDTISNEMEAMKTLARLHNLRKPKK